MVPYCSHINSGRRYNTSVESPWKVTAVAETVVRGKEEKNNSTYLCITKRTPLISSLSRSISGQVPYIVHSFSNIRGYNDKQPQAVAAEVGIRCKSRV